MNILFIQASQTAYGVLSSFTESLYAAFSKKENHNTYLYKPQDSMSFIEITEEIHKIIRRFNITHIFSFNAVCSEHLSRINTDAKFIAWLVDYPVHHENRLNTNYKNKFIISGNEMHSNFVNQMTSSKYLANLTLGINSNLKNKYFDIKDRPFDLCISGSWMGQPEKEWLLSPKIIIKKIGNESLDELIANEHQDVYTVLLKNFNRYNIDLSVNKSLMGSLIRLLIAYLRKYERIKMLKAAEMSGLKVLIVGEGWSNHCSGQNIYFHEPVPFEKLSSVFLHSKTSVCFNSNHGGCERAIEALSVGSSVFSFGGESINSLSNNSKGFCIQKINLSINSLAKRMIEWHESITNDNFLDHETKKFIQDNSWEKVSQTLIDILDQLDVEDNQLVLAP